ncbi:MAG: hypothetical protein ACYDG6_14640 [Thermincolia bacterium]
MAMLSKIKIGGFDISIKQVKDLWTERKNLGEYYPRDQEIRLDDAHTKQQAEETLIHEVFEAFTNIYDINIEHEQLSLMATVWHQILKDNPEFVKMFN